MEWSDVDDHGDPELRAEWAAAPDDPPTAESDYAVTMEKRPGGREGQELREVQTGASLASTRVAPLTDESHPRSKRAPLTRRSRRSRQTASFRGSCAR